MRVKLRQLEMFHILAEEGSVSKAALRLNVTQPAISTAISTLEADLGFQLFMRQDGAFVLTPEARLMREETEQALIAANRVAVLADHIRTGERGIIRVSAFGAASVVLMPLVIAEFTALRDKVDVILQLRDSAQVQKFVGGGQADVGVVEGVGATSRVRSVAFDLDCVCIMRADDRLAAVDVVTPEELSGRRLIGVAENHRIDQQIERAFAMAGVDLRMPIRGYSFAAIRNLVRNNAGVAIIDAVNGVTDLGDGIVWRPFQPSVSYEMSVISSASLELSEPAQMFHDLLVKRLHALEHIQQGEG